MKLVKYLLREKIVPKLTDLRMATLILVMYTAALRFEEAAAIDLKNIETLVSGNISITLRKGKMNQLAKDQVIILPKADAGVERDLDVTQLLHRYTTPIKNWEVKSTLQVHRAPGGPGGQREAPLPGLQAGMQDAEAVEA